MAKLVGSYYLLQFVRSTFTTLQSILCSILFDATCKSIYLALSVYVKNRYYMIMVFGNISHQLILCMGSDISPSNISHQLLMCVVYMSQ